MSPPSLSKLHCWNRGSILAGGVFPGVVNWVRRSFFTAFRLSAALLLAVAAATFFSSLTSVRTTFAVDASTEIVSGDILTHEFGGGASIAWSFPNADICAGQIAQRWASDKGSSLAVCDLDYHSRTEGPLSIELGVPIRFQLQRNTAGTLYIGLESMDDTTTQSLRVNLLNEARGTVMKVPLPAYLVVDVQSIGTSDAEPLTLPVLSTELSIGRETSMRAVSSQPMLLAGDIRVSGKPLLSSAPYLAGTLSLRYGDIVEAKAETDRLISSIVRADKERFLKIISRVESRELSVRGFFAEPRKERLSFLQRLTNDPILTALWSFAGLLAAVLALVFTAREKGR